MVGLTGVLLALLLYTIREPVRRGLARHASALPAKEVFAYIFRNTRTLPDMSATPFYAAETCARRSVTSLFETTRARR